jgi:hypothetical protein
MKITKGIEVRPLKSTLHGYHGTGKSSLASEWPNPIFIRTEDRVSHINADKFDLCTRLNDVQLQLDWLADNEHDYKTVVLDSADWLEALIHQELCREKGKKSVADFGYGKGYADTEAIFREVLAQLDTLRDEKKMHVIVIAHSEITRFSDPTSEDFDRYQIAMHKKVSSALAEWSDNIFFLNVPHLIRETKDGTKKGVSGANRHMIYTEPCAAYTAKNSFGFAPEIEYIKGEGYSTIIAQYKQWIKENKQDGTGN